MPARIHGEQPDAHEQDSRQHKGSQNRGTLGGHLKRFHC